MHHVGPRMAAILLLKPRIPRRFWYSILAHKNGRIGSMVVPLSLSATRLGRRMASTGFIKRFFAESPGYYRIRLGDTHPELLVDLKGLRRFQDGLGSVSGITPDGSPLFVRDLGTDEIYALDLFLP